MKDKIVSRVSNTNIDSNIVKLFIIYLLSYFLLLLNTNALYWDDWVLYHQSFVELQSMFRQLTGNIPFLEYFYYYMGLLGNGVLSFRIAVFICYFLSGLFLYLILLDIKYFSKKSAFYISLIFLILPVNSAKVALSVAPYGFFNCMFFFAFWLLTLYHNHFHNLFLRVSILICFFISFYVSSHLVFYAIPLMYLLYKITISNNNKNVFFNIKSLCYKYPDFLCIPILFWFIKNRYFAPYGLYKNYNHVNLGYVKTNFISNLYITIKSAFFEPLVQSFKVSGRFFLLFVLMYLVIALILRDREKTPKDTHQVQTKKLFVMGFLGGVGLFLAIFPYNVVGKIPGLYNFESRHMLLIPLGMALIIYALILFLEKENNRISGLVLVAVVSSFTLKNNYDQFEYIKDWFYQVSIEEQYKSSEVIKDNTTFVFKSDIPFATKRSMQFYESSGRLRKVFGDDKRFMADNYHEILLYKDYKQYKRYNYSSWELFPPLRVVVNAQNDQEISFKRFLELVSYMLKDDNQFRIEAKKLTTMRVEPLSTKDI